MIIGKVRFVEDERLWTVKLNESLKPNFVSFFPRDTSSSAERNFISLRVGRKNFKHGEVFVNL